LLHRTGTDSAIALVPERSKLQCGMIGIAGLDVHFQTVEFGMNENDSLLFYTDGITEAQNLSGQDYGLNRLKYSFSHAESGSAEKKLASVLRDFMIFVDDAPLKDDVTIIVLKRSAKSEKIYKNLPKQTSAASNENAKDIEEAEEAEELEELEEAEELEELNE
ncbi:MAG: SpoIIE family protein phosphatase, partial [Spirochaetaceae bacterium]|nr:SpoIIE family protein phosphatase [Spirochaetaceae bacterium]